VITLEECMTATTTSVRPRKSPRASLLWIVPVLFAIAASLFVVNLAQTEPGRSAVTVENETGAYVTLSARGDAGGWLGLGTVDPRARALFESVADQGAVWRFRLEVGPDRIGEIVRTRRQLEQADWMITIPADAADGLNVERRSQ
jgi:hypothetical protein